MILDEVDTLHLSVMIFLEQIDLRAKMPGNLALDYRPVDRLLEFPE